MSTSDNAPKVRDRGIPRTLTVKSATNLTPNMRRVTHNTGTKEKVPPNAEGAFMKLVFNQDENVKPIFRTYTLSLQRSELNEVY